MSEGLKGFPDCVFYQYHFIGGPQDGEVSTGFRPYFRLITPQGCIYEVPNTDVEFIEWLDDGTRKIELHFVGMTDVPKVDGPLMKEDRQKIRDPDRIRKFFDPHPGLMGCPVRIPEEVRLVASELNGTYGSLKEAVDLIRTACPKGIVEAHEDKGMITLRMIAPYRGQECIHSWRVIQFE